MEASSAEEPERSESAQPNLPAKKRRHNRKRLTTAGKDIVYSTTELVHLQMRDEVANGKAISMEELTAEGLLNRLGDYESFLLPADT